MSPELNLALTALAVVYSLHIGFDLARRVTVLIIEIRKQRALRRHIQDQVSRQLEKALRVEFIADPPHIDPPSKLN